MRLSIEIKHNKETNTRLQGDGIEKMTLFSIDEYGNTEQSDISIEAGGILIRSGIPYESM